MDEASDLPLVTVTVPTYNRLPLLRETVASVVAQTYRRWELVVSDDGSTDGTAAWVRGLGDPRITVVESPHTGHLGAVRNRGAAAGTGELVAFLDSDDLWFPASLETMVRAMAGGEAAWVYGDVELMNERGETIPQFARGMAPRSGWIAREVLTTELGVCMDTVLMRREYFDRVGRFSEDPRLPARGDHELGVRLALNAPAVAVPDVLVRVREHPGRTTTHLANPSERSAAVYDLFLEGRPTPDLARVARRRRAHHLARAGAERLARGEYAAAAGLLARSFADRPLSRGWADALFRGLGRRVRGRVAGVAPGR